MAGVSENRQGASSMGEIDDLGLISGIVLIQHRNLFSVTGLSDCVRSSGIIYNIFIATAPAHTVSIDAYLTRVIGSFRKYEAMTAAKTTDVSRSAATRAIGARVIAQSASP